jgi:RNA polymerase sigma-70 factor (ECF subfamily)
LNPRAAEIFVLRYFEGYGNREIARLLQTSWSTVAVTLHRTRTKLKNDLKGELR